MAIKGEKLYNSLNIRGSAPKTAGVFFSARGISATVLKIIACVAMVIDHSGELFFPKVAFLRILGRLAFPIFAFFIAEGCSYTKNPFKYLLTVLLLGVACETVYIVFTGSYYGNILLTFSVSIFLIFCLKQVKKEIFEKTANYLRICSAFLILVLALFATYSCIRFVRINFGFTFLDYGFTGVLTAVIVSLFDFRKLNLPKKINGTLIFIFKLLALIFALVLVALEMNVRIQFFALFAVLFLLLYNGQRGRGFKYAFYAFYPIHLGILELIYIIIYGLN